MNKDQGPTSKVRFNELKYGNYHEWRHCLLTYSRAQRLSKYLEKDLPEAPPDQKEEFDFNDAQALSLIHSTVDSSNYQIIANCNTACSAFLALCSHHNDGGGLTTASIFSDLVTMKLANPNDLETHLHQF